MHIPISRVKNGDAAEQHNIARSFIKEPGIGSLRLFHPLRTSLTPGVKYKNIFRTCAQAERKEGRKPRGAGAQDSRNAKHEKSSYITIYTRAPRGRIEMAHLGCREFVSNFKRARDAFRRNFTAGRRKERRKKCNALYELFVASSISPISHS